MLAISDPHAKRRRGALAHVIQNAINNHLKAHPMSIEELVATMAFCTGSAIGVTYGNHRALVEIAGSFLAEGEEITSGKKSEALGSIDIRGMLPN